MSTDVAEMPKKSEDGPRQVGVNIKATTEWAAWARRGAKACGLTLSAAVDVALRAYFKKHGFTDPPPER